jgi:anti-sigma factor (TIGR02949 family)
MPEEKDGPTDPKGVLTMDCRKFHEYLYPFLDRELDENISLEVRKHASGCPVCSLELEKERKFGDILKAHLMKERAPFALREAILQPSANKEKRPSWRHVLTVRLAPAFVLAAVVITVVVNQRFHAGQAFPVFREAVKNHLEYLRGSSPLEFQTGDMREALAWFRGKTDFAVTPPHLVLDEVRLVGGRIVHLKDKKSAYFLLEKDGYKISAFYMDLQDALSPKASAKEAVKAVGHRLVKTEKGYHTVYCFHPDDGTACILVTDMPLEELKKLIV